MTLCSTYKKAQWLWAILLFGNCGATSFPASKRRVARPNSFEELFQGLLCLIPQNNVEIGNAVRIACDTIKHPKKNKIVESRVLSRQVKEVSP